MGAPPTFGPEPTPPPDRADPRVAERWRDGAFELVLRPQRWGAFPLVFFALVWNLFLVGWYRVALLSPGPLGVALWFPLLHVLVGGLAAWAAAAALLNRTVVHLSRARLDARARPLPQPGAVRRATTEVAGFVPALAEGAGLRGALDAARPRWTIAVVEREGGRAPLPLSFDTEREAERVAQRLEGALASLRRPVGYRA